MFDFRNRLFFTSNGYISSFTYPLFFFIHCGPPKSSLARHGPPASTPKSPTFFLGGDISTPQVRIPPSPKSHTIHERGHYLYVSFPYPGSMSLPKCNFALSQRSNPTLFPPRNQALTFPLEFSVFVMVFFLPIPQVQYFSIKLSFIAAFPGRKRTSFCNSLTQRLYSLPESSSLPPFLATRSGNELIPSILLIPPLP